MSIGNSGAGLYGTTGPGGSPIGLSPAMLEAMIVNPTIRALIQANGAPNTQSTTGLMNWANSQANSSRAIAPTIPGLTLPPQIQQILAQRAPLAQIAQGLQKAVPGTPAVNPTTGQFAPGGTGAPTPTSAQAPTSGATGRAPRAGGDMGADFTTQIVNQAVQAALANLSGGLGGGSAGAGAGAGGTAGGASSGGPAVDAPAGGGQGGVGGSPDVTGAGAPA